MCYAISIIMSVSSLILALALAFGADIAFTEVTLYIMMAISVVTSVTGFVLDIKEEHQMYD